ncbi:MAG: hypothetical protein QME57_03980 [Patescibacteria group bacterium]|nr:hypothetical protein [Patescibacteria group bacterium]
MRISRLKIKKIKEFLKRLPRTLGERAFFVFLGLLLLALIFGGIIFYKYNILVKKVKVQIIEEPLQFQEKAYQDILKIWQEKEKKFQETDLKQYPNPFKVD